MNVIAGTLLLFMEEEQAFWTFAYMVEGMLKNSYDKSLSGLFVDIAVFEWLLSEHLLELYKHLKSQSIELHPLLASWFLCLYVTALPYETAFWVWDNIMLDGIVAMFEIGLALFHMLQKEMLQIENIADFSIFVRDRTSLIYDPASLRQYWIKLDKDHVELARHSLRNKIESEEEKFGISQQFNALAEKTHFDHREIKELWKQYIIMDPLHDQNRNGLEFTEFSKFVGGTFSEWWVDCELVEQLFNMADVDRDGSIDFVELVVLLSVICRGTEREINNFTFRLFELRKRGWMDRMDVYRMLLSLYGMYRKEDGFNTLLHMVVEDIFINCDTKNSSAIARNSFNLIGHFQPQIMQKFANLSHSKVNTTKNSLFYWLFTPHHSKKELIHLHLDHEAPSLQNEALPLPLAKFYSSPPEFSNKTHVPSSHSLTLACTQLISKLFM